MDWSRAKTILIFIFLILNIFLVYNISKQENKDIVVTQQEISDIKAILEKSNIELKATISNKIKPKSFLKIEDFIYKEEDLANRFFGSMEGVTKTNIPNAVVYKKGSKSIEIYSDKKLIYKDEAPTDNIEGFSKSKAINYVQNYLKTMGIYSKDAVVDRFDNVNYQYKINFKQELKGNQIFASYMNIELSNKGITRIERVWVKPVEFFDAPKDIKAPTEILLIFAKDFTNKEKVSIDAISLGYYFPLEDFKNATVSAIPAWKIELSTGQIFFYNAYDGYLER